MPHEIATETSFHYLGKHFNEFVQMRSRLIKGWKGIIRERWVLGRWSRQMSFRKSLSRVEGEHPSGGVTRKARGKALG
jgi:hypothetical protein